MHTHRVFEVSVQSYSYLVHKMDEIVCSKLRPHYRKGSTASFTLYTMLSESCICLGTKAKKISPPSQVMKPRL
jgi:hypothetical protein